MTDETKPEGEHESDGGRPPPRRGAIIVAVVLVVVLILVAIGLYLASRPPPQQVQGMIDTDTISISSKVPARVKTLLAHEGDAVRAGQAVAILESPELVASNHQASGALVSASAAQARADNGDRPETIASIASLWHSALAQADLAAVSARRAEALFAEGVIARQRRDEAVAARASSAANAEAAHQQYLKALAGSRPEDKAAAAGQVQVAQGGLGVSDALLADLTLVAPIDGEISQRFANPGEVVIPAAPLFSLIDLHDLWVTMNLREDQYGGIAMGHVLHGHIPALDDRAADFRVSFIRPQGDFATERTTRQSRGYDVRSFEVRARPVGDIPRLRPGMSVLFDWPQ